MLVGGASFFDGDLLYICGFLGKKQHFVCKKYPDKAGFFEFGFEIQTQSLVCWDWNFGIFERGVFFGSTMTFWIFGHSNTFCLRGGEGCLQVVF